MGRRQVVVGSIVALVLSVLSCLAAAPASASFAPGAVNLGPAGPSAAVAPAPDSLLLRDIDRDAGISVRLSDGKSLWLFADTTLFLGSSVVYFSGRGSAALADPSDLTALHEPTVPYGFLSVPAAPLIDGGDITCPDGTSDYYWPTSAVAVPQGGGRDHVLVYYAAVCGTSPDLTTYRTQTMGVAEYDYDTASPPSAANPIVAHVKNAALFPPMPGHVQPGPGYGTASFLRNGVIYVYGCHYSPSFQSCTVARTTPANALTSGGYTYWDGATWNSTASAAADMVMPSPLVGIKGSVAWIAGVNKYVFVDNDHPNAQLAVRFADLPQGPWTEPTFVALPDCVGRGCRAGELHAEASNGSALTMSYFAPGMLPAVRLVRVPIVTSPIGNLEVVQRASPTTVTIGGWTLDPDSAESIPVAVYVDGQGIGWFPTDQDRPDVGAAYPGYGSVHGFSITLPVAPGTHQVCVYAINRGPGSVNPSLGCRTVTLLTGVPLGVIDAAQPASPTSIALTGWALDPDSAASIPVAVYLDGQGVSWFPTDQDRPDVGAAYPGYGSVHGFSITIPAPPGTHQLCLYAINTGPGGMNPLLDCHTITLLTGTPFGSLDRVQRVAPATIEVAGWAIDPDTAAAIPIAVHVDGVDVTWFTAVGSRPDVGAAYPGYGPGHGYDLTIAAAPGTHEVCTYAINAGPGTVNPLLGCRTVTVLTGNPIGVVDRVQRVSATAIAVDGWAVDPDTAASIPVAVYVDGVGVSWFPTSQPRPDVAAALPGYGPLHGFRLVITSTPDAHLVCVYAINAGRGSVNPQLRCVGVPAA